MTTKLDRERIALKLPIDTLQRIDNDAAALEDTRTGVIEAALEHLIRDMHHDAFSLEYLAFLRQRSATRTASKPIQIRLPKMYLDYLRINQYNITACIKAATILYSHDK